MTCGSGCANGGAQGYSTQPAPAPAPTYPTLQPVPQGYQQQQVSHAGTSYATNGYTTGGAVASDFVQGETVGKYAQY